MAYQRRISNLKNYSNNEKDEYNNSQQPAYYLKGDNRDSRQNNSVSLFDLPSDKREFDRPPRYSNSGFDRVSKDSYGSERSNRASRESYITEPLERAPKDTYRTDRPNWDPRENYGVELFDRASKNSYGSEPSIRAPRERYSGDLSNRAAKASFSSDWSNRAVRYSSSNERSTTVDTVSRPNYVEEPFNRDSKKSYIGQQFDKDTRKVYGNREFEREPRDNCGSAGVERPARGGLGHLHFDKGPRENFLSDQFDEFDSAPRATFRSERFESAPRQGYGSRSGQNRLEEFQSNQVKDWGNSYQETQRDSTFLNRGNEVRGFGSSGFKKSNDSSNKKPFIAKAAFQKRKYLQSQTSPYKIESLKNYRGRSKNSEIRPNMYQNVETKKLNQVNIEENQGFGEAACTSRIEIKTENKQDCFNPTFDHDESEMDNYCEGSENPRKTNAFIPSMQVAAKYKYFPPTAEEMGKLFEGFVIYYNFDKTKNTPVQSHFIAICVSFSRSTRYNRLTIEDGYNGNDKTIKYCTMKYGDILMARGVSYLSDLREPRFWAAIELINKLAATCYTLKMKEEYFCGKQFLNRLKEKVRAKEVPGVFRAVGAEETPDIQSAYIFIENFYKDDSDSELIFTNTTLFNKIKSYASHSEKLEYADAKEIIVLFRKRSPEYWRDKILASGKLENEQFRLIPPTGIGFDLIQNFDITTVIPKMRNIPKDVRDSQQKNIYAQGNQGLNIQLAKPPWEKKGPSKNNAKKIRKIKDALKQGTPLSNVKAFRHLNKKQKSRLKKAFPNFH